MQRNTLIAISHQHTHGRIKNYTKMCCLICFGTIHASINEKRGFLKVVGETKGMN